MRATNCATPGWILADALGVVGLYIISSNGPSVKNNILCPNDIYFFIEKVWKGVVTMQVNTTRRTQNRTRESRNRERARLRQLLGALGLSACLLLGRQFYPQQLLEAGERVLAVVSSGADFSAALTRLGERLSVSGKAVSGLREFCVSVFGPLEDGTDEKAEQVFSPRYPQVHAGLLSGEIRPQAMLLQLSGEVREETAAAAGTVLISVPQQGQELPEGHTMDKLSLGGLETTSPVVGELNSGFGYRDHPVNGKHLFHSGADINADSGDPIGAFADGVVEYLGEDSSYGLYLQIDHGNGVKSFYAHCQSLCVQTGQRVTAGETVALVGATGTATGPHLHLELKCGGLRVDPAWYVELLDG